MSAFSQLPDWGKARDTAGMSRRPVQAECVIASRKVSISCSVQKFSSTSTGSFRKENFLGLN